MKFLALLCVVGLAAASSYSNAVNQIKWEADSEYEFDYSGRLLTGLPELANHYTGLGLRCRVRLTVGAGSTPEHQEFGIKISNAQYVRINQVLKSEGGDRSDSNWRHLPLPSYTPVPEESRRALESPVVFKLNLNGGFRSIVVSEEEPEWSINFKKALVSLFQTQWVQDFNSLANEISSKIESVENEDNEILSYWRVKEESLDGICDVTYQVNELPTYMIKEKPEMVPYPQECSHDEGRFIEITRTRDVSSCTKRTSFSYYKPGFYRCSTGNCEGMWSKSSITRYVACTQSKDQRQRMSLQSIVNEGELQQNLFGQNTEKFLTGNQQKLKLVSKRRSSNSRIEYPSQPAELKSLFYEYRLDKMTGQKQSVDELESLMNQQEMEQDTTPFKALPRHILTTGTFSGRAERQSPKVDPSRLVPQIKRLFNEIVEQDLLNVVDVAEKQVTFKGLSIARAFSLLPKEEISKIFHELKGKYNGDERQEIFSNVFFDTLVMGGSVSNIQFIKDMIFRNELHTVQMVSFFTFLPHYVLAPTQPLLESLYELITSSHIKEKTLVYNHAIMSYTQLLQKACIADNRETSYPTFVFGNFCQPDSPIVITRWIPYLQRELYQAGNSEHRNTIVVALGLLSHKNIISAVSPIIEQGNGRSEDQEYQSLTRFLAIYALGNVGRKYPELVVPMVYNVYANPAEVTEVRLAAFNVILRMNPSMSIFHRIAASTWYEKDNEVLQVVNTALYSLGQQNQEESLEETYYSGLQRKAWLVYPLIRKTEGTFPSSGAIYTSEFMKRLGVGYRSITSWVDNKDSLVPQQIYSKLVYLLDRYEFSPFEFAIRLRGGENLVQQILELVNPEVRKALHEDQELSEQIQKRVHHEFAHVIEKLRLNKSIKRENGGKAEGALYMNLFEDSPIFYNFQSASSEILKEKVLPALRNPERLQRLISGEGETFNFQRFINLSPNEFSIPSEMGWPIIVEVHMPTTLSLRGKLSMDTQDSAIPSFRMDVKVLFATQNTGYVGTICPFTNEFLSTGVDEHSVINVPADFSIGVNVPEHKLHVRIYNPAQLDRSVDLMHYHIRPYTVHQEYYDLTPMTLNKNVKYIESGEENKRKERDFGEYLGLNLKAVVTSQSAFLDMREMYERFRNYNYNPLNVLRFGWLWTGLNERSEPSFRKHEMQLKYNPNESSTKEIEFQVEVGFGTKQDKDEPIKYHVIKKISKEEQQEEGKVLPFKVCSKPVGQQQEQQSRQEKVKETLEKLQVQEGGALNVRFSTLIKGGGRNQRSWTYSLNVAGGRNGFTQKWNVHLDSEHEQNKKFCVNGHLNVPKIPFWDIEEMRSNPLEFTYENTIGFGNNCESKIVVQGMTKSNQEQKEHSKKSQEAQNLEKLIQKGKTTPELNKAANAVRKQASILNEVDFTVRYENMDQRTMWIPVYVKNGLKAFLWPYLTRDSGKGQQNPTDSMTESYRLVFNPRAPVFDLYDNSPRENIRFMHVRIPYPFTYLFPLSPIRNSVLDLTMPLIGKPVYPTCKVNDKWIETFDNVTSKLILDDCFHVLSTDCSRQKRFAVMIRQRSNDEKELKIFLGKTEVQFIPEGGRGDQTVKVNGTRIEDLNQRRGQWINVKDQHGDVVCRLMQSVDRVTILESKEINVQSSGRKIQLEASYAYKNQLCGLCGDLNLQKLAELRGPTKKCVYSKPQVMAAAYRVSLPSHQCGSLQGHVQQQLEQEQARCAEFQVIPTKVVKGFKAQSGKCSRHQHNVIERPTEICFSRIPVMECGATCKSESTIQKRIPFACMNKSRLSVLYTMKARQGQILPELENLPETFSTELPLPRSCQPINRNI